MAKAKKYKVDLPRLTAAMRKARQSLQRFREERRAAVRQYVGRHWSEEGTRETVPVNLISLYVGIVGRTLIAKDPRVMLSTFDRNSKAAVKAMEQWVNREMKNMNLANTLQRVVVDALFSIGICKVALSTPQDAASVSWNLPAGQPFAERVDLDDFVFDVHARDFSEVSFIGHRYRVPLDSVRDSKLYSARRKELTASNDDPFNQEGDEKVSVLGRGYNANAEEFEEHVDLWEVYLPRYRTVLTLEDPLDCGDEDYEPLRQQEWIGPDCGPYHILGYLCVPGNAMPKAPIQDLCDLHEFVNKTYRKLFRQADRQKSNTFVMGGADEDGSRVMSASDGEILRVDNPDKIKEVVMGGPNQGNFLLGQHAWELFSKMGGNLEMMGGLAPQSKTASQDKMLAASASGQIASMQQDTIGMAERVIRSLCWYFHYHPELVMKVKYSLPGLPDATIQRKVSPQQRSQIRFEDMDIEVDPYSMQQATPQTRVANIQAVLQQIQPFMQLAQAQGVMLDVNALLTKYAGYLDMPDLAEILTIQEPPQPDAEAGGGGGAGGPAETTRNYVRRSLGGEGEQSQSAELANTLAKGMGQEGNQTMNPNGAG